MDPSFQNDEIWIQGSGLRDMWHKWFIFQRHLKDNIWKIFED